MAGNFKGGYYNNSTVGGALTQRVVSGKTYAVEETVEEVLQNTRVVAVPQMSLSLDAAKYFGIRSAVSGADGISVVATYLPYPDKYGKLIGFKKRDWTLPKDKKGHFTVVGTVKASSQMFGQRQVALGNNRKQINILEGEGDVTAAWEAAFQQMRNISTNSKAPAGLKAYADSVLRGIAAIQQGKDPEGLPVLPFVGINCGTANATETCANNEKFIRQFEKVVLAFDNDEATLLEREKKVKKGKEATDDVASFLLSDNIFVVKYPNERNDPAGYKDVRDMYDDGKLYEIYVMFSKADDRYVPDKLIGLSDISVEDLRKKKKDGVPLIGLPQLYNLTKGPRTGELWTITGPSGAG